MDQEKTDRVAGVPPTLTRRQMLKEAAGAGMVLLLPMFTGRADAAGVTWTAVGKATDFALNQPQRVAVPGGGVLFVTRTGKDRLTAVSAKCTHRGCEVGWDAADKQFACPCHGAAFAPNGANLHGTRRDPEEKLPALAGLPVRQNKGRVEVNLQAVPADALVPGGGRRG